MNKVKIFTDPGCNLTEDQLNELGIDILKFNITYKGKEYLIDTTYRDFTPEDHIEYLKTGSMPSFSRPPMGDWKEQIESYVKKGLDIIYVSISQHASGSGSTVNVIYNLLKTQYPDRKIGVFDSYNVANGIGYCAEQAALMANKGLSYDEIMESLIEVRPKAIAYCLPNSADFFTGTNRGDSTEVNQNKYNIIYCDLEGNFKPYKTCSSRKESLDVIDLSKANTLYISYTTDVPKEELTFIFDKFKDNYKIIDCGIMSSFNATAMGFNSIVITAVE